MVDNGGASLNCDYHAGEERANFGIHGIFCHSFNSRFGGSMGKGGFVDVFVFSAVAE